MLPARHAPRKLLYFLLAIGVVAAGAWLFAGTKKPEEGAKLVAVTQGDIEDVVTAQGKVEPKEYVDVGTQVSGQLKTLQVDIGQDVKQGELLAEIDPRIYEARVEADLAQLASLKAQLTEQEVALDLARAQHARNETLVRGNAISKDAFDVSKASVQSAAARVVTQKAQVKQMESTLQGDKTNLGFTKIYAPISGTVVTLPARVGQTLNASQTAPTLLQLANLDIMTIRAQVAEADVMRLKESMKVSFSTLGSAGKRWRAAVRQILPSPEVVNDVVLYNVLIDVDNKDRALMNGMSTQIFFEIASREGVPVLPVDALGKRGKDGTYTVKLENGEDKQIRVGLMDRTNAEITEGLNVGDNVQVRERKTQNRSGSQQRNAPGMGGPRL